MVNIVTNRVRKSSERDKVPGLLPQKLSQKYDLDQSITSSTAYFETKFNYTVLLVETKKGSMLIIRTRFMSLSVCQRV